MIEAYSRHHHLSIRPEDVWFSILAQLSFYINANAEELRSLFVAHEGQKGLVVVEAGTIETVHFGQLAVRMTEEIDKNLVDSDLREWIMPNFTTTTETDTITAAILMMGSMQKYFSYTMCLTCGIPSVTLLGEKEDWENIRRRLDKLPQFGKEPEQFALLLSPVLDYFIRSFESANDPKVIDFWSKIAHKEDNGSGPDYLSGWITAFCFWDAGGELLYRIPYECMSGCNLDGTVFHKVDIEDVPAAYVSVPVLLIDNGNRIKTEMIAGSVGIAASSSKGKLNNDTSFIGWVARWFAKLASKVVKPEASNAVGLDSIQPISGWWMYKLVE